MHFEPISTKLISIKTRITFFDDTYNPLKYDTCFKKKQMWGNGL